MKKVNFWKTLFLSALAVTAFTGCSNDDSENDGGMPSITVNGESTATGAVDLTGGTLTFEVVSSSDWTLAYDDTSAMSWCHVATAGKGGTTSLEVTVDAWSDAQGNAERTAKFTLTTYGNLAGVGAIPAKATITVMQNGKGSTELETNVAEIRALVAAMNPPKDKVDASDAILAKEYLVGVIAGAQGETPNMGNKYLTVIQDTDNAENSGLMINQTNVSTWKTGQKLQISLAGAKVQNYNGTLQISLSNDATVTVLEENVAITPVELASPADLEKYQSQLVKFPNVQTASEYKEGATYAENYNANFVTDKGESFVVYTNKTGNAGFGATTISNLSGPIVGIAGCYQKDNAGSVTLQLLPRSAEDVAGLTNPRFTIQGSTATIADVLAGGEAAYKVENATVVAVTTRSFVMQDATGAILVFRGYDAEIPEVGSVVTVDGLVTTYGGMLQFDGSATVTKNSTTTVSEPSATEVTASNIQSIIDAEKVVYVKMSGELVKSGTNYNLNFLFEDSHSGSIDAPAASLNIDNYVGQTVDVYGWFIYTTGSGVRFTVVATKIESNTTTPSVKFDASSLTFAAEGAEAQTVGYTAQNVSGNVEMSIEGTNADKFKIESNENSKVTVAVVGDNTSDAAYTAQLVAKVGGETLATVDLTQSKASTTGATVISVDFSGNYPEGVPTELYEKETKTFMFSGYEFTFVSDGANGYKFDTKTGYLIYGKTGAYVQFPAIAGKTLTKVVAVSRKGASGNVTVGIADAEGNFVGGGDPIKWEQVDPFTYTYNLTGTVANTGYCLRINSKYNAQLVSLELTYE